MNRYFVSLLLLFALISSHLASADGPRVSAKAQKRFLVVVTSHDTFDGSAEKTGYWLGEVAHFQQTVKAKGFEVDYVSPRGGVPPMDERSRDLGDALNQAFVADPDGMAKLNQSLSPDRVNPANYAAIYFAGGHGPLWDFPRDAAVQRIAMAIYNGGGIISAVCHGPAGLLELKIADGTSLLRGRKVTGLDNLEEWLSGKSGLVPYRLEDELKNRGAKFDAGFPFLSHVVVDGRLITGQNPKSAVGVAEAVLRAVTAGPGGE